MPFWGIIITILSFALFLNYSPTIETRWPLVDSLPVTREITPELTPTATTTTTTKTATTTAKLTTKKVAVVKTPLPTTPKPAPVPLPELVPLETLNERVRPAMVNIFCITKSGGDFKPITGSGIIVDPKGIVLTNAHVAEYFLLRDYQVKDFITCVGRSGSPAVATYSLELLYLPKIWLEENALEIKKEEPTGTGENDYAFLAITGRLDGNTLPEKLPFVEPDSTENHLVPNLPILLEGYPANFLGGIEVQKELWLIGSPAILQKLYYFKEKSNVDAFSMGGNIVAQKGSSGGVAINQYGGKVIGIITTISEGATTEERNLVAISLSHISRSLSEQTKNNLADFLKQNIPQAIEEFRLQVPALSEILIKALK